MSIRSLPRAPTGEPGSAQRAGIRACIKRGPHERDGRSRASLLILAALVLPTLSGTLTACAPKQVNEQPGVENEARARSPDASVAERQPAAESAGVAAPQRVDPRPGLAVFPFAAGISIGTDRENLDALSIGLQQILITELAQNPALRVVDRSVIRQLLEEQDLGASGRVDDATAARIGRIVGAKYVVTGGFNDVDRRFRLDGRIVNVETSEVLRAEQVTESRDQLYGIVVELAQRVTRGVNLPPLSSQVRQERERRSAALPREAVILYSQAQYFHDRGQLDRARQLYRRVTTEFPALVEAQEALRRLETPGG
jgi:TolB-like protein